MYAKIRLTTDLTCLRGIGTLKAGSVHDAKYIGFGTWALTGVCMRLFVDGSTCEIV